MSVSEEEWGTLRGQCTTAQRSLRIPRSVQGRRRAQGQTSWWPSSQSTGRGVANRDTGPSLGSSKDVAALLADSINQLRRGQLDPRIANSMACLGGVLLKALEQGPVEERLAKLEEFFAAEERLRSQELDR
jgi:hypothetical protein